MTLLHDMNQLVREDTTSRTCSRSIVTLSEYNITPNCVRQRVHRACRLRRLRVSVHSHLAEVVAETRLEERAGRTIERLAGRAQHFMYNRRNLIRRLIADG